ncbi:DUF7112 family protein [Halopenitus persicus]|uniref:Uncharacterized protein n=1 Tax=Halopenitus persicus TaxID=1048396 RepID=A0A1H3EEW0_9EURY|nr:hypothetical protein [Halopenitus persicus]QHS17531.1 hypothetical protein GWK26_10455 [haloarchaeon 3A1-DGR]SDX77147.1 hypothetical protein SAMN05216564_101407 [Halopenitus persicus]
MARITSDDESVAAVRTDVVRSGGTRRPCLRLPDDDALARRLESGDAEALGVSDGDVIRLSFDRETRYARVDADSRGRLLRGAFDNRRLARSPGEGENRLLGWLRDHDRAAGDTVLLDVVVSGDAYGLRLPGDRSVYDVDAAPRGSLADIARDLDG